MMETRAGIEFLADALSRIVGDLDVVEFMHHLTEMAAHAGATSAVGAMLADEHGRLRYMAASSADATLMELLQLGLDSGPCVDAFADNDVVDVPDLGSAASRWSAFVPVATRAGFRSVHAVPLRLDGQPIGAMGYFGRSTGPVTGVDGGWVDTLASLATVAVAQEAVPHRPTRAAERVKAALRSRVLVEQAKGVVAQVENITADQAFVAIREHARGHGRRLVDVAASVVETAHDDTESGTPWWRAERTPPSADGVQHP